MLIFIWFYCFLIFFFYCNLSRYRLFLCNTSWSYICKWSVCLWMNWLLLFFFAYDYLMDVQKCTRKIVHCDWIATCIECIHSQILQANSDLFYLHSAHKIRWYLSSVARSRFTTRQKKIIHYVNSTLKHSISMDCLCLSNSLLAASSIASPNSFGAAFNQNTKRFPIRRQTFSTFESFLSILVSLIPHQNEVQLHLFWSLFKFVRYFLKWKIIRKFECK